jgi:Tfp pilus assembly protein PilN
MSADVRVGIVLGRERMTAVQIRPTWRGARPGRVWTWTLPAITDAAGEAALAAALSELRASIAAPTVRASIALLRPLAHAKVIAVPPLGRRALELLVQRNTQRYFIVGSEPALATACPAGPRARQDGDARAVAVCASERTIASITSAATAASFTVEGITAAPVALREAIRALVPQARRGHVLTLVGEAGWTEALLLVDDALRLAQPLPTSGNADADALARTLAGLVADGVACGCRPERALVVCGGAADAAAALSRLDGGDERLMPISLPLAVEECAPGVLAAFGAALVGDGAPLLFTDAIRETRRRRARARTYALSTVAAAMLAAGAAAHLWSARRELDVIEARRRALAPALATAMANRQVVDRARVTLLELTRAERGAPRWTGVLSSLARALPPSAYLLSLSTTGTRIQLSGVAASAHAVVSPLEASPTLSDVALTTASRRDGDAGGERFELSALVDTAAATRADAVIVRPATRTSP